MSHSHNIPAEFPDDLFVIKKLRSVDFNFNEICEDLELLGRDLAEMTREKSERTHQFYTDTQESYQALRQEIVDYLGSHDAVEFQKKFSSK